MKIACLGDSITKGYGVSYSECWVSLLNFSDKYELINKGINGDTTSSMLERVWRDVFKINSQYCIILAGTNDFLMGRDAEAVFDNIALLAKDCISNKITPMVCSPIPTQPLLAEKYWDSSIDYKLVNEKINNLAEKLKSFLIENNFSFIDLHSSFNASKLKIDMLYIDGLHPSALGHRLIAQHVGEYLSLL